MATRPSAVAFDVVETLMSLQPLGVRLEEVGQPASLLPAWFARLLLYGVGLSAAGDYLPFPQAAAEALRAVTGYRLSDQDVEHVLAGFADLPAHPDAEPAMRRLADAGVRLVCLTNGTADATSAFLARAGLERFVERVISTAEVHSWKPPARVYHHAVDVLGLPAEEVALVAVHAWDCHGAKQAGLTTGWASRAEGGYGTVFAPADVTGTDLVDVADGLLALPTGREGLPVPGDGGEAVARYPMVEPAAATGTVAAVYAQISAVLPFVPSLFKSLAVCPPYLALAWEQAAPALRDQAHQAAAAGLAESVRTAAAPPDDARVREAMAQFVAPLSRMLLVSAGLREALAGRLDGAPAGGRVPPAAGPVQPPRSVPAPAETSARQEVYGEIRVALRTPLINSIWLYLAGQGLLEAAWAALAGQVEPTRQHAAALGRRAAQAARGLTWPTVASPTALEEAGIGDVRPGMAAILDCYLTTLPRVLTLVACCAG